jgi:succinate-semialdehyde dehydrogenase/glutarate-semialdehyde dehydrogenase
MNLKDSSLLREQIYFDGIWRDAIGNGTYPVYNPSDLRQLASVPDAGVEDAREAIAAANAAWSAWKNITAGERSSILKKWCELLLDNVDDLALILSKEQGKPFQEAKGEIRYGASFIEWFAEEAKRVYGDIIPADNANKRIVVLKQPVGVVAAITPWNFPNAMITRKVAPALAAGCTVVVKPAEETPLSALALAVLAERAGIPAGVFNVITTNSPSEAGREFTSNSLVRKLSFTGSTEVGKLLMSKCAGTVKKISLELGGNAPFIVFDDADIDQAVEGALASKYRNAGQTCICANRFLVQETVFDEFVEKFTKSSNNQKVGDSMEEGVTIGPLINKRAMDKVEYFIADALSKGAQISTGGKPHSLGGTFFEPTVIIDVRREMLLAQEEIFGPVAPIFKFKTEEEAISIANDTPYGLAAYFYGRDIARVWRVAEALEYGMVGINTGIISTAVAPFGGLKESGIGREGSKYGIEEFLEIKYLCFGGVSAGVK